MIEAKSTLVQTGVFGQAVGLNYQHTARSEVRPVDETGI